MAPEDIAGRTTQAPVEAPAPGTVPDLRTGLLIVVAVILLGWALRATGSITVPLVAAVLISLAIMPVRDWVRARMPKPLKWLGLVAAMGVLLLVLVIFFGGIWFAAQRVVGEFASQAGPILDTLQGQEAQGDDGTGSAVAEGAEAGAVAGAGQGAAEGGGTEGGLGTLLPDSPEELLRSLGSRATGAAAGAATAILNGAMGLVAGLVLVFFFTLLILAESDDWREKLRSITRPRTEWRFNESAEVVSGKVRAYVLSQAMLGAISATLYFGWLTFWGVDLRIVWVPMIFLLNFIPTLGSLVGGTLPVAFTLLTQGVGPAVGVGAGILVIEQVMGNLVTPRLQSRTVALSPLMVLVSLAVWGWIWGIPGALLAVPVTTALVVFGAHVPALRPWALLLTDRTTMRGLDEVTRPE
ncbi:hypothetical protein Rumeso_03841 [Rubellimicrobium mesophilum DSM 19309]|uniref:Transport protein n=1 Tax=Rubellimicrobium mesophilum DSM 19309 TaxID=442562 RepID=A0A017HJS1_9RHOB|nr:AI-2E family transporter [Rubellimicrobium mesophilum]EYD74545.1 hypothetical protein Rumeso_03841 [Rubellimicrobium mesophilum DSM 19309]